VISDKPKDRRRRGIPPLAPLLLYILILAPGCRKAAEEPLLLRLIDVLERKGIVDSPLLDYLSNPEGLARDCPNLAALADKYPLLDAGTGKNPLLLKKKMRIGPLEENGLLAAPKSVFRLRVKISPDSTLEFGAGIYWGADPIQKTGGTRQVDFSVSIKHRNGDDQVFNKKMTLTAAAPLTFHRQRVDLAGFAGQEVDLVFTTRGRPDSLAFWFNPIIFRTQDEAPNVILVSLDTLRADHLACYGYGRDTSPNLDKLAADSVLFQNTFAPSPWTLPSHVSLLTGLDEVNHQVHSSSDKMDADLLTLADLLRPRGFVTNAFTGGGFVHGVFGLSRGFDSFRIEGRVLSNNGAKTLADSVLPWLENNRRKKFFLFLHTYQIHQPYFSPAPFNRMFLDPDAALDRVDPGELRLNLENRFQPATEAQRRNYIGLYDAEIRYTDEALIGALVDRLKKLGLYDRTMLVVTSDHGEEFYEHKAWAHGHTLYNETIKIPLLVKFPGSRKGGTRVDRIVRLTDIMPTILEEMGIDFPRKALDGRSLLDLVREREAQGPERTFRSERSGDLIEDRIPGRRAVNQGGFKVIVNELFTPEQLAYFRFPPPNRERLEVYDLAADPGETLNLVLSRPDLARSLMKYLEECMKPTGKRPAPSSASIEDVREELKALGYIR